MDINNMVTKAIPALVIGGALIIIAGMVNSNMSRYLKIKAIDDCGKVAQREQELPDERAKVSYPVGDMYKACLKDKGY